MIWEFRVLEHGTAAYEQMLALRLRVLLQPIGIDASYINREAERSDLLLGVFETKNLIACCVLTPKADGRMQLRQMAVETSIQGEGLGARLLRFAESLAQAQHYKSLFLHAREVVVPFYEKCGYAITGQPFEEVGITHRVMEKQL